MRDNRMNRTEISNVQPERPPDLSLSRISKMCHSWPREVYSALMWQIQEQGNDGNRSASMFMRTQASYKMTAQQHKRLPDGSDDYTWNGDLPVKNISSLRLTRQAKVYAMLARQKDSKQDELIHQTEHFDGPILLHCLLHTGAIGKKSRVLLKSIEVHAEVYNRPAGLRSR